jgi:hypothetical protein
MHFLCVLIRLDVSEALTIKGTIHMARVSKRILGIVAAATVVAGTALGVAVTGGTAHAQGGSSLSLTSATDTVTTNSLGNQTAETTELTYAFTCPVGYYEIVNSTITQGASVTVDQTFSSRINCTGDPQTVSVTNTGTVIAPGQALVAATLTLGQGVNSELQPPVGLAQIATIGLS